MKRVLLDENLPQPLRHELAAFDVVTVGFMGWSGIQNGELVSLIDDDFDVLLTGDQNLRYQQNLQGRRVAIVELPFTRFDQNLLVLPDVIDAISHSTTGSYTQLTKKKQNKSEQAKPRKPSD